MDCVRGLCELTELLPARAVSLLLRLLLALLLQGELLLQRLAQLLLPRCDLRRVLTSRTRHTQRVPAPRHTVRTETVNPTRSRPTFAPPKVWPWLVAYIMPGVAPCGTTTCIWRSAPSSAADPSEVPGGGTSIISVVPGTAF